LLLLMLLHACQGGSEGGMNAPSGDGEPTVEKETLFHVTRDQFKAAGMEIEDPGTVTFTEGVQATGIVKATPSGRAEVSTLIPGRIQQIYHTVGENVSKGDLLFSMESNEYIELQQEYATVTQRLKLLEVEYERQKTLYEQQVVAEKEFLRTESEYRTSLAMMEGLRARLRMTNTDPAQVEQGTILPYLKMYAPIQGIISGQELVMGGYITPGEVVVNIVDPATLQLYLQVFEKDLEGIEPGQQVLFFTPDRPGRIKEATLLQVGRSIDPVNKKLLCTARITPEKNGELVDNLYVEASIVTSRREVLAVPEEAILHSEGSNYLFTLESQNDAEVIFQARPVQVGAVTNGYAEILDRGLKQVLVRGAASIWMEE
jgi:cobalt-zinc-cadmium efflux system membrane fusion protein